MNFQCFAETVLEQIPEYISGNNYRFFLSKQQSNNELEYTLHIEELDSTSSVIPAFYLDTYYSSYTEGVTLEVILIQIAKSYGDFLENQYLTNTSNRINDDVVVHLINTSRNQKYLESVYHCNLLDLSIVYHYSIDQSMSEFLPVRRDLIEITNLEDYHKNALRNTKSLLGIEYIPMDDSTEISDVISVEKAISKKRGGITMITNKIHLFGAAILAIPEYMEELSDCFEDDLVIIPSSIHEIGVIKFSEIQISIDKLRTMVQSINKNDLDPSVVLSDNLYLYSRNDKTLHILE